MVVVHGGKYTVTEELQAGWVHTTAGSVDATVQSGDTPDAVWFGNFKVATVIVWKYEDADGIYIFGGLKLHTYRLEIILPQGYATNQPLTMRMGVQKSSLIQVNISARKSL